MILNILIPFGGGTISQNGFIEVVLTHCMTFNTKSIVNHVAISCISCPRMIFIEQRFFIFCKLSLDGSFWPDSLKFRGSWQKYGQTEQWKIMNVGGHSSKWAVLKTRVVPKLKRLFKFDQSHKTTLDFYKNFKFKTDFEILESKRSPRK